MEPLKKLAPRAQDMVYAVHATSRWSGKGFQNFLESGIPDDFREVIKKGSPTYKKALNFLEPKKKIWEGPQGCVSLPQLLKLMDFAPRDDVHTWEQFWTLVAEASFRNTLWEARVFRWIERDEYRLGFGLDPLNPRIKSTVNPALEITFKRTGHCSVWQRPPEGYRYATKEEILSIAIPDNEDFGLLAINENESWEWWNTHKGRPCEFSKSERASAFHALVFMVPIVKLS